MVRKRIFDIPVAWNNGKGKIGIVENEKKEEIVRTEEIARKEEIVVIEIEAIGIGIVNVIAEIVIVEIEVIVGIRKGKEVGHQGKDEIEIGNEVNVVGIVIEVIAKIEVEANARNAGGPIVRNAIEVKGMETARGENEVKRVIVNEGIAKAGETETTNRVSDVVNAAGTKMKITRTRTIITTTSNHGRQKTGKSNRRNPTRTIIVNVATMRATHQTTGLTMIEMRMQTTLVNFKQNQYSISG